MNILRKDVSSEATSCLIAHGIDDLTKPKQEWTICL